MGRRNWLFCWSEVGAEHVGILQSPYVAALEVNAGYFAERGVNEGDCVSWPGSCDLCGADDPAS